MTKVKESILFFNEPKEVNIINQIVIGLESAIKILEEAPQWRFDEHLQAVMKGEKQGNDENIPMYDDSGEVMTVDVVPLLDLYGYPVLDEKGKPTMVLTKTGRNKRILFTDAQFILDERGSPIKKGAKSFHLGKDGESILDENGRAIGNVNDEKEDEKNTPMYNDSGEVMAVDVVQLLDENGNPAVNEKGKPTMVLAKTGKNTRILFTDAQFILDERGSPIRKCPKSFHLGKYGASILDEKGRAIGNVEDEDEDKFAKKRKILLLGEARQSSMILDERGHPVTNSMRTLDEETEEEIDKKRRNLKIGEAGQSSMVLDEKGQPITNSMGNTDEEKKEQPKPRRRKSLILGKTGQSTSIVDENGIAIKYKSIMGIEKDMLDDDGIPKYDENGKVLVVDMVPLVDSNSGKPVLDTQGNLTMMVKTEGGRKMRSLNENGEWGDGE